EPDRAGKVFLGHGHSPDWQQLRDFLVNDLNLQCDEFNAEPAEGIATKERLEQMLGGSSFAFLVATGEDATNTGAYRARENVIHEIGLFQGRLGFRRAIVIREEG